MHAESTFRFTWNGHSAGDLETPGGKTIVFDPWFGNPKSTKSADAVARCDVLLVSHGHFDHLGGDIGAMEQSNAIAIARRLKPTWVTIHELSVWLGHVLDADAGVNVIGMNAGGTVEVDGLRVTMTPAVHSAGDWSSEAGTVLNLGQPVGFVIELENGRKVYFAGDTDVFGDMALIGELHAPEIAFLPIGGHFTMGPKGAARAAQLLGVARVVPIHYGTFPILVGTPDQLREELQRIGADVEVLSPEPGQTIEV
jgi:L-ascorbate metabolism protein UlaG (beta-lactamase superfamily)